MIKWIKLSVNLFDDEKIKLIKSMPDGYQMFYIWINLLCLCGKSNQQGFIILSDRLSYNTQMLATIINVPESTVRYALEMFEKFGMLELHENNIHITNWEKHQNIDYLEKIREQNNIRKQRQREKEKLLFSESNETKQIIDYLNQKTGKSYKHNTTKTVKLIETRKKEGFNFNDFKQVIDNQTSAWLNTDMEQYLRPETLFGNKFEGYLNNNLNNKKLQKPTTNFMKQIEEKFYEGN